MGRTPCCNEAGLKKGAWTPDEDQKLVAYIQEHGEGGWRTLPQNAGLQRCGKSCRLRWTNYLRPDIKRGEFSTEEEQKIIQLHASLGNKWSAIASHLPKRTDNEIKNYWNTHIKKRLIDMGIDPVTHKQIGPSTSSNDNSSNNVVEERSSSSHSQRSISTSAKLLNKFSAKIAQMHSKEMLLSLLNSTKDNNITTPSHSGDVDDSDIEILESAPKMSKQISCSGSSRILNKMATKLAPSKSLDLIKNRLDVVWKQSLASSSSTISDTSTIGGSSYNNIESPISASDILESMPTPSSACESSKIFTRNLSMGEEEVNEAFQAIGSSHSPMYAPEMGAYEVEEYLGNYGDEDGTAILNNDNNNNNNVSQNNMACDSQFDISMGPTNVEYSDFIEHFTNMPFGGDYVSPNEYYTTIDYYCGQGESYDGIMSYWNEDFDLGNYAMQ